MDKEQFKLKLLEIKKTLSENDKSYPQPSQMVKNVAQSIVRNVQNVMQGNDLTVSETSANSRLNICKSCSFFDHTPQRCTKCGCKMAVKTYLKAEKCPIGKW